MLRTEFYFDSIGTGRTIARFPFEFCVDWIRTGKASGSTTSNDKRHPCYADAVFDMAATHLRSVFGTPRRSTHRSCRTRRTCGSLAADSKDLIEFQLYDLQQGSLVALFSFGHIASSPMSQNLFYHNVHFQGCTHIRKAHFRRPFQVERIQGNNRKGK